MELINIFKILRRWAWLIAAIVVVTSLVLFLGLQLAKPVYEAQVKLQLSTPQQEDVAVYDQYRSVNSRDLITIARNNLDTILQSDELRVRTLEKLNLDPEKTEFELETKPQSDSDFLFVTVRASSPALAASLANTLVSGAVDNYGELRAKSTIEEKALYAGQLKTAEEEYRTSADAFTSFKAENNVGVLTEEVASEQRLLEQLQAERDQRKINIQDPSSQVKELIAQRQSELDRLLALQPMYLILEANYQEAREAYRLTMSTNYSEGTRKAAQAKYSSAEQSFNEYKTNNNITSLDSEIASSTESLKQLQLTLDQRLLAEANEAKIINQVDEQILLHQKELDRLSAIQPTYNVLEERANEAQSKYQRILTKYTEAELKATVVRAANFIQVIEPAQEPLEPVNSTIKFLALGILGSLGVGVILAFLLDYLYAPGEEELLPVKFDSRSILSLPVLGMIPILKKSFPENGSSGAESIRQLRTNILLSPANHPLKSILIASPQPGDGKTFITAKLGSTMADGKSRIVLVDADLRHPYLHEVFNQPNCGGLAELLSADEAVLEQSIVQYLRSTEVPGLSLLPAGKPPQDPSYLLSSHNMRFIFKELAEKFDFILVDCPPTSIAPDSTILSRYVDGILLVFYPGKTGLKVAEETVHTFTTSGFKTLGVVLNHTSSDRYSYQYHAQRDWKAQLLERAAAIMPSQNTPSDPELISMEEAARKLGVQRKTVTQWCQGGQIKARWINWRWWVKREELQNFLKNRFGVEAPLDN